MRRVKPWLAGWPVGRLAAIHVGWHAVVLRHRQVRSQGCTWALFPVQGLPPKDSNIVPAILLLQPHELKMTTLSDQVALKSRLDALAASLGDQLPLDSGIQNGGVPPIAPLHDEADAAFCSTTRWRHCEVGSQTWTIGMVVYSQDRHYDKSRHSQFIFCEGMNFPFCHVKPWNNQSVSDLLI